MNIKDTGELKRRIELIEDLQRLADAEGYTVQIKRSGHHVKVKGEQADANWYPFSQRMTLWENCARYKTVMATPQDVIQAVKAADQSRPINTPTDDGSRWPTGKGKICGCGGPTVNSKRARRSHVLYFQECAASCGWEGRHVLYSTRKKRTVARGGEAAQRMNKIMEGEST